METHFAPAGRSGPEDLAREIEMVRRSPVVAGMLESVSGMLAILNSRRQILALNSELIEMLGVGPPEQVFGLRPGAAVECVHAAEGPDGCGTSEYCATCGAAVAIVTALGFSEPVERICALRARQDDREVDICLRVRAAPLRIGGERCVMLFLRDITDAWNRAALERIFFHDINNQLGGLMAASALLEAHGADLELVRSIHRSSRRLSREVAVQAGLFAGDRVTLQVTLEEVPVQRVLDEVEDLFTLYPVASDRTLLVVRPEGIPTLRTDEALLQRVLANMVTNAMEASDPGDRVELRAEAERDVVEFCVWNRRAINDAVALRIFQRNFTTKDGEGRGLGTFSMKLIGERYLGGDVGFHSDEAEGTRFWIRLPTV